MKDVSLVDPFRCRMWELHDRLEGDITEETCRAEIESFLKHGQLVPAIGRPLRGDLSHSIELIVGARRLFVARHLNKPLAVEMRGLSDREAVVTMDAENRQRRDVSPYERGLSYARWLRAGLFDSQDDIARTLNVSASQISRLLKMSKLPTVIVNAFPSASDICERWGLELIEIWESPQRRDAVARAARAIGAASPRPPASDVYRRLLASSARGRKARDRGHDEVVLDDTGAPLFRIRHLSNSIAVLLPLERVSASSLASIRQSLSEILNGTNVHVADTKRKNPTLIPGVEIGRPTEEL